MSAATTSRRPRRPPAIARRAILLLWDIVEFARFYAHNLTIQEAIGRLMPMDHRRYFRLQRVARWATALAEVLAGKRALPSYRAPAVGPRSPGPHAGRRRLTMTEQPTGYFLDSSPRTMWEAFHTRSIGEIVVRLCREMNVKPGTTLWPTDLVAMTMTPAAYAAARFRPKKPRKPQIFPPPPLFSSPIVGGAGGGGLDAKPQISQPPQGANQSERPAWPGS